MNITVQSIVVLIVIGVCFYLVDAYIPMSPPIKTVVRVVMVLVLILWLLQTFGVISGTSIVR